MRSRLLLAWLLALCMAGTAAPVSAQTPTPPPLGAIYIVQPNENLSTIADRFNLSINQLMVANGISDPNLISEGQRLVIPGLQGINGILDTEVVHFGDSFRSLVRRTQITPELLQRLNHVVSPTEFYVGAAMIVPKQENAQDLTARLGTSTGQSLLELAAISGSDPWTLASINGLGGTWDALPGDVLYNEGTGPSNQTAGGLPPDLLDAEIPTLPLAQGTTAEIIVTPAEGVTLGGDLASYPLHFFPMGDGRMVALQGIHAMLSPGVYPLQLDATAQDGAVQSFQQLVVINPGGFPKESLSVPAETIDPAVTGPEDQQVMAIAQPATDHRYWTGEFELPVGLPYCIRDGFGTRRSFNGSAYDYFHSGVDYGVCSADHPFDIYAAAPGVVVFAGPLNVRGNATFIDHGWGVYTGYFHQRAIHVSVGEKVEAGQLIGEIGDTGRVTGPHLHFDLWVGDIQVNPLDWLSRVYP
jgi:murein DD-endopeptidase MepM/ murein hydrolase activator NlpD